MIKSTTRVRVIQGWFAAVAVAIAVGVLFGVSVSFSTGALLLALSLAPPILLVLLWPEEQPLTVAEVLHDVDGRD
jgi:hypothetical protein